MIFSGEPCCHPRHWAQADEMEPGVHRDTGLTQLCWARGINGRVGRGRGGNGEGEMGWRQGSNSSAHRGLLFAPSILLSPTQAVDPKSSKPLGSLRNGIPDPPPESAFQRSPWKCSKCNSHGSLSISQLTTPAELCGCRLPSGKRQPAQQCLA